MTRRVLLTLLLAIAACGGPGGDTGRAQGAPADPTTVTRTGRPNDYLVCPPRFCAAAADRASESYGVPAEHLAEAWQAVVAAAPRTRLTAADPARGLYAFEQRSAVLGFRDTILVRIVPLTADRSTLVVYSRSEIGYWDLGVNRRRVEAWLAALGSTVPLLETPS
jgi:uncharacterized protein (DUF1499 family)